MQGYLILVSFVWKYVLYFSDCTTKEYVRKLSIDIVVQV